MSCDYKTKLTTLLEGRLTPGDFSHADHIGVTFEALKTYDFFKALRLIADGIRSLAMRAGVPEKYNATVTLAYVSLISERMAFDNYENAQEFIDANLDLLSAATIKSRYSHERLISELSRTVALLPDIPVTTGGSA